MEKANKRNDHLISYRRCFHVLYFKIEFILLIKCDFIDLIRPENSRK